MAMQTTSRKSKPAIEPRAAQAPSEPGSLAEKIAAIRLEADAFIDSRAQILKQDAPGVPFAVLRNLITDRSPGCACQAALSELEADRG